LIWPDTGSTIVLVWMPAQVVLLWCMARVFTDWCCVPEGCPGAELLPPVRREGLLTL
jgi:hypothetical protein